MFTQFCFQAYVFPQTCALKGFPFLDLCKQDMPVSDFFPPATHSSASVFEVWLHWTFEGWLPPPGLCRSHPTSLCSRHTGIAAILYTFPPRQSCVAGSITSGVVTSALQAEYLQIGAVGQQLPCRISELHDTWKAKLCLIVERCLFSGWSSFFLVTAFDRFSAVDLDVCFLSC